MNFRFRFVGLAAALAFYLSISSGQAGQASPAVQSKIPRTSKLTLTHQAVQRGWPRPALLIPELPESPQIDGAVDAVWDGAAPQSIAYPLGSDKAGTPDTRFRIGHRGGNLYLLLQYDWPENKPLPSTSENAGALWADDGAEIFFSRLDRLGITRQLLLVVAQFEVMLLS